MAGVLHAPTGRAHRDGHGGRAGAGAHDRAGEGTGRQGAALDVHAALPVRGVPRRRTSARRPSASTARSCMPGETFSLNDTIKERTEKNGYTEGFVVGEGGVFAEALGGGVSASATTGVDRRVLRRHGASADHRALHLHLPLHRGLEATVAWGIFDMKFRNDTPNGVFITSSTTNTSMTVSLWGTKEYDDIDAEFGERTSIVPFDQDLRRVGGLPGPERAWMASRSPSTGCSTRTARRSGVSRSPRATSRPRTSPAAKPDKKPARTRTRGGEADVPAASPTASLERRRRPGRRREPTRRAREDDVFSNG